MSRDYLLVAHNYTLGEVQDAADFVGDSLELARRVTAVDQEVIVFAGVDFMAETAAILNPGKKVIHPDICSQCAMAARITSADVARARQEHPGAAVVSYVNTPAAVKAVSDITCTSANAVWVVESLKEDKVIFTPDQNLAAYVAARTDKEIIPVPTDGCCPLHHALTPEQIRVRLKNYPDAEVIVHPETPPEVQAIADHIGSTSQMIRRVGESDAQSFIVGTEVGLIHRLKKEAPEKTFIPASDYLVCPDMKMITLEKIERAVAAGGPVVKVDPGVSERAAHAIERMLAL
ncbi:MAG: quinolinate synthase NadA [Methanoculleaceae archaeon]